MTLADPPRLPVTILTGFLGSGKTTLLASLLRRPSMERTAVLINEFGEVPLDQALLGDATEHVVVLAGGCLCCITGRDVTAMLLDLWERHQVTPFERVVIETSGLADPGPILALFAHEELALRFRLEGVVTVVDGLQGERELSRQKTCVRQVALADRLLLTKTDISSPHAVSRLRDRLAGINPWAPLETVVHRKVEPEDFFPSPETSTTEFRVAPSLEHSGHAAGVSSFCLTFAEPLSWNRLSEALTRLLEHSGDHLLRIKGILNLDASESPMALHGGLGFLHPLEPLPAWPDGSRESRIVFIGEGLHKDQMQDQLMLAALAGHADLSSHPNG